VLPIGGVREKVLAAYRLKMSAVILPERNEKDLVEVPSEAVEAMEFLFAKHMDQVLDWALVQPKAKKGKRKNTKAKAETKSEVEAAASS
jgi:ATP-dependent Lon protease